MRGELGGEGWVLEIPHERGGIEEVDGGDTERLGGLRGHWSVNWMGLGGGWVQRWRFAGVLGRLLRRWCNGVPVRDDAIGGGEFFLVDCTVEDAAPMR